MTMLNSALFPALAKLKYRLSNLKVPMQFYIIIFLICGTPFPLFIYTFLWQLKEVVHEKNRVKHGLQPIAVADLEWGSMALGSTRNIMM